MLLVIRSGATVPALLAATLYDSDSASVSGDQPRNPYASASASALPPMTAEREPVAVALADSTAAVSDVTEARVVPAVMPVAAITRPASFLLNVPPAPVTAV